MIWAGEEKRWGIPGLISEKLVILLFGGAYFMSDNKKFAGRFAGKGYYIALILCAVAIGVSGYLYYRIANQTDSNDGVVDVINPGLTDPTLPTDPQPTEKPTQPTLPQPLKTGLPVEGNVVMEYAMDCLCYNPTTRDWRVHDGVDYAAAAGTAVKAAADGTVYTVYEDDTMGYTVVITHADGYVTTYSSLDASIAVSPGDQVQLGQSIGYVGCSAMLETAVGEHLHFSVTCDGESIDPEEFFALGQ